MVPTRTGKPGQKHLPVRKSQGILLRLEKSGNFIQNTGKIRTNYAGKLKKILEKSASNSENPANIVP